MTDPTAGGDLMTFVQQARSGDRAAMDEILRVLMPDLQAYVRVNTGKAIRNMESCADLVQSVCREAVRDIGGFRGEARGEFRRWLFTVALRKIQDRARYLGAQRRNVKKLVALQHGTDDDGNEASVLGAYATVCTPSQHAVAREEVDRIEAAFDRLSEDYRTVLSLCCFVGLSHREVAIEMGRPETAVRKLLSRARARLLMELAGEPD